MSRLRIRFHENPAFPWNPVWYEDSLPAAMDFASAEQLQAEADAEGLADIVYLGPSAFFPDCKPQKSAMTGDLEELIAEQADAVGTTPDAGNKEWPTGYPLLRFLAWWRLALMENGAYLELSVIE